MDQGLHRGAHDLLDVLWAVALAIWTNRQPSRPGDLLVLNKDRTRLQLVETLLDDVDRLFDFGEPDQEAAVHIARGCCWNVEFVVLESAVGVGLAQIPRQSGRAQDRASDSQRHTSSQVEVADALRAAQPDRVVDEQVVHIRGTFPKDLDRCDDVLLDALGQVVRNTAGSDVRVVHANAGDRLEQVQHKLAVAESDGHTGQRAQFHTAGGDGNHVRRDPGKFRHHHANDVGAVGDLILDAEQLLNAECVDQLVVQSGHVIHAGNEGRALSPGPVFHVLFDTGVQVADGRPHAFDSFSVKFNDQAQHSVGGGVLRAHVDDQAILLAFRWRKDGVPVIALDVVDRVALTRPVRI